MSTEADIFELVPPPPSNRVTGRAVLLDIDSITVDDRAIIRMWCWDPETNKNFQVVDGHFKPYFYLMLDGREEPEYIRQNLQKMADRAMKDYLERGQRYRFEVETLTRKWYDKDVPVMKVTVQKPGHIAILRDPFRRVEGVEKVLEADFPFHMRYAVDKRVEPTSLIEFHGAPVYEGSTRHVQLHRDGGYARTVGNAILKDLTTMAYDMEVWNKEGFPTAQDPITILTASVTQPDGSKRMHVFKAERNGDAVPNDRNVCESFVKLWEERKPHVVFTYNGDNFDWPHFIARCQKHNIPLPTGRDGRPIQLKEGGGSQDDIYVLMTGVANVDLYRVAKRDLLQVKQKGLDNVAEWAGIPTADDWLEIPVEEMWAWYLDDGDKHDHLVRYAIEDTRVTHLLGDKLLPLQTALSRYTTIPLGEVARAYRGNQVEWYLIKKSQLEGKLVPNKNFVPEGQADEYEGATVLTPIAGLHENVTGLDFSGLYPSIMEFYNISPETYIGTLEAWVAAGRTEAEAQELYHVLPALPPNEDGELTPRHMFRKEPDGFMRAIIKELKTERKKRKTEMSRLEKEEKRGEGDPVYDILDLEQSVIKVLNNSLYGYTGWQRSRYYVKSCAESVTAWGRHMLLSLKHAAETGAFTAMYTEEFRQHRVYSKYVPEIEAYIEQHGMAAFKQLILHVLYGDTDSVFVQGDLWMVALLAAWADKNLPVSVEFKEQYERVFFPGPKKRYCGLNRKPNPKTGVQDIVIKGLETKRGDWSKVATSVQKTCIELILRGKDIEGAARYARGECQRIQKGMFDIKELTINKRLTKPVNEFTVKLGHIEALKRAFAADPNYKLGVGDKIAYVVLKKERERIGPKKWAPEPLLNEKTCVLAFWDKKTPLDLDYYLEKQIVPAAMRLLEFFGYDEDYFLTGQQQSDFSAWVRG